MKTYGNSKGIVKGNLFRGCWLPVLALALLPATYQGCSYAFFGDAYSEKKYQDAIETVYGVTDYNFVLAPGLHTSKNTPANYVPRGVRRFFQSWGLAYLSNHTGC